MISIIIPCYNAQDYIEECVHSAYAQTHANIEVICIDNNSTDQTLQKLEALHKTYPALIIDKEPKPGAPAARNKGLALAKGDWIQFLDADDLLMPNKIEHQSSLINNSISFIAGASIHRKGDIEKKTIPNETINVWENLAKVQLGITSSNLFSKQALNNVSGWNEKLKSSQEYDLMFRILKTNTNVVYDNNPLTIINQVENSITRNPENVVNNILRRASLLNQIREHTIDINEPERVIKEIEQALFDVVREMYLFDSEKSCKMYSKYFNNKYSPIVSTATNHKYITLHALFGFRFSHNLIRLIKKLK